MRGLKNYIWALAIVAAAFILYLAITHFTGQAMPPFITFIPAIMIAALVGGFGPGFLATIAATLLVDFFIFEPKYNFGIASTADVIALIIYGSMGIFMSVVAQLYLQLRKNLQKTIEQRTAELKNANELLEREIGNRKQSQEALEKLNSELEHRVEEQVGEILTVNETLEQRIEDRTIELQSANEFLRDSRLAALNLMQDAVDSRKQTEKVNRTLRAIGNSNQAMMHAKDETQYLKDVCDIIVRDCGHMMVWVGYAENDEAKSVRPVAYSGFEEGYLETLKVTWADNERGRGPTGTAIRTGKISFCRNMQTDPAFEPWRAEAIKRGYASSIVLPLISEGKVFGALTIYSQEADPFTQDEVNLLNELAGDLAYGISSIRLRIDRDEAEEALRKSHDELEIRVKERTADLDEAVVDLQKQVEIRVKAEERIKTERQRLYDVLETLPAYVCLLTPDYYMPFANKVFREWFGYQPEKKCYEFLFNRKEPCEKCETYMVLKTNKPQRWEWTGPNGRSYDIFDYPFKDTDGSQLILEMGIDVTEQKQAEKALRSTSLYARGLLEAALDPLVTISADGKITDVNKATELATGLARDQLIGTDFSNYFTEPDKARQGYRRVFADGFVTDYPLTIRNKNGQLIDVLYNAAIYKDETGEVGGVFAAARDVTIQKQASQYARSLLESSLDPLVTISADGKITDVNEATSEVTGVDRQQLIGTDFSNYFTEPGKAREGYKKVFDEGFVTDYPLTIRHKDGHLTDVLYNATVYKDTHDNVLGVFAAARDITERKRAERRQGVTNSLLELYAKKTTRKEYLDSAVEVIRGWSGCSRVGIRVKDDKGHIPYESFVGFEKDFLALENHLHLEKDKCLCMRAVLQQQVEQDKPLLTPAGSFYSNDSLEFIKGLSKQEAKDYQGNCMRMGFKSIAVVPIRYRYEVLGAVHLADLQKNMLPLAKVQFIEMTVAPLIGEAIHRFNAEAELEKYRLHLEDLVKVRTEELVRSNKDLEQFAYVASHDLQEPLRAVSGFIELLRRRLHESLDEQASEYMNHSVEGAKRMQSLINGLLEYSRVGTMGKKPEKADSKEVLDEALARLHASISESGAKITSDGLPVIYYDDQQLARLFQNLIGNAIKFRSEKIPHIHISAVREEAGWRFAVSDNGIGIEPQYVERIFMIFQRLHTRKAYPGTGIGLSICKKIVERHGGRIWVESAPGSGSTFYFTVPDEQGGPKG